MAAYRGQTIRKTVEKYEYTQSRPAVRPVAQSSIAPAYRFREEYMFGGTVVASRASARSRMPCSPARSGRLPDSTTSGATLLTLTPEMRSRCIGSDGPGRRPRSQPRSPRADQCRARCTRIMTLLPRQTRPDEQHVVACGNAGARCDVRLRRRSAPKTQAAPTSMDDYMPFRAPSRMIVSAASSGQLSPRQGVTRPASRPHTSKTQCLSPMGVMTPPAMG